MSNATRTMAKGLAVLLAVALIIGAIAVIYKYTNGFNEDFKTFYVEHDGKQILTAETKQVLTPDKEYRYDVKYTFDAKSSKPKDYTVKVLPYCTRDFEITAGGKTCLYSRANELTSAFNIQKHDTYFALTVTSEQSLTSVLSEVYGTSKVVVPSDVDENNEYLYSLAISSYNGSVTYCIRFCIDGVSNNGIPVTGGFDIEDITLDPSEIILGGG